MNTKNSTSPFFGLLWRASALVLIFSVQVFSQQYTFKKIGLEQGMPSSRINDFVQDSRGFFWLASEGAGLVRYDGFEFKTIDLGQPNLKPVATALAEDNDGNIWYANTNGLVKYDGLEFRFYYLKQPTDRINKIVINGSNEVFAAGRTNVYRVGGADTLETLVRSKQIRINDMAWYDRSLWFATDSGLYASEEKKAEGKWYGLAVVSDGLYAAGVLGTVFIREGSTTILNANPARRVSANPSKQVSLGSTGLIIFKDNQQVAIAGANGLPEQDYEGCFIDLSGVVWLFSNNGLVKLESTAVKLYSDENGINSKVYSVLIDGHDRYLAGAANGLSVIEGSSVANIIDGDFPYGVVLALAEYQGQTWLGTERGLIRYNGQSFQEITLPGSIGGYVFALKGTAEGLYIGTSSGIFSYKNGRVENISERENLPFANIYAISEGKDGSLWFGTYTQGFIRKYQDSWEVVSELGIVSLDSLRFNTFTAVSRDEIWTGTPSEGIFHITKDNFQNISAAELNFAEVRSLAVDENGKLWLSSNKGLSTVSKSGKGYNVKQLNAVGSFVDEGCSAQALEIRSGRLLAGTARGLLIVSLEELQEKQVTPKIALTQVELYFGDSTGLEGYSSGLLPFSNVPGGLELPHDLNFLSFTLAGLSGYHPEELLYRYRIKQQDAWTLAGNRREAVYSNLKPGNYRFQAQVSRDGENWSPSEVNFAFVIKSPVWQRWWFIVIAVLLAGGMTYAYLANRIKRINQRLRLENSLLEMERKALRLQMNPHFIFNALDSISSFIFKNDPKQAVRYLNNFAKLMRLTLESSMEHLHPVETEVSVLKNYLELEMLRFKGKFEYEIELDDEIDYDVGIPPMLIQPHVENAILHGIKPKEGMGHLSIRFILKGELLICEVEDDGIGRKRAKELPRRQDHRSMATQINKDRLRLLKISKSDEIDIEIIDKENHTGTKVIIKLPAESI